MLFLHAWPLHLLIRLSGSSRGRLFATAVVLLSQRLPLLRFAAEAEFASSSRLVHLIPWTIATLTGLGTTQALSGASGVIVPLDSPDNVTGTVGEPFQWRFMVDGADTNARAFLMKPSVPGLSVAPLPEGKIPGTDFNNFGHITGIPEQPSVYAVVIEAWEELQDNGRVSGRNTSYNLTITVLPPPPPADPWVDFFGEGFAFGGNGWAKVPWFGDLHDSGFPWTYHADHGWLSLHQPGAGDGPMRWFYDRVLGWCATSPQVYPNIFIAAQGKWMVFISGSLGGDTRLFYDYIAGFVDVLDQTPAN